MIKLPPFWKKTAATLGTILVVFLFSAIAGYLRPVQMMELKIRDLLFEIRGPADVAHSDIVIVEMSQDADFEIPYKYPWPTYIYGKLIENLNRAGVRAIGIDVIFDQLDLYDARNDSIFAAALAEHKNVVLAGTITRTFRGHGEEVSSDQLRMVMPNRILREASPNPPGLVNMVPDRDEFIRSYFLYTHFMGTPYYSLSLEILRLLSEDEIEIKREEGFLRFGPYRIPLFHSNTMLLHYYGGERTFRYIGLEEVIDDESFLTTTEMEAFEMNLFDDPDYGLLHRDVLRDKIVLVGATMPELQDFHPIPISGARGSSQIPGVEIHANALQAILDGNFLYQASGFLQLFLIFLFSALVVIAARTLKFTGGIVTMLTMAGLWAIAVVYLFISYKITVFFMGPFFAIITGYGGVTAVEYLREEREKQRIKEMFSSYVSPQLVEKMVTSEDEPRLGGEKTEITAFFSDIQSFSTFSEKLEADRLVVLMNEYLSAMTDILLENNGTLDKYIGDAIVAFWNAPMPVQDHASKACISSQLMIYRQAELRKKWKKDGHWPDIVHHMQTRIGLNTGQVVTGNIGSSRRFNYTMMGDNVNLAARCESGAKAYGVYTMTTQATRTEAEKFGNQCLFRKLDKIVVKGRTVPVTVYEIAGLRERIKPAFLECVEIFERGLELYWQQDWNHAKKMFSDSAKLEIYQPDENTGIHTNPSLVFLERCEQMKTNPPQEEWNGVYVMKTK